MLIWQTVGVGLRAGTALGGSGSSNSCAASCARKSKSEYAYDLCVVMCDQADDTDNDGKSAYGRAAAAAAAAASSPPSQSLQFSYLDDMLASVPTFDMKETLIVDEAVANIQGLFEEVTKLGYHFGEKDTKSTPVTGMIAELNASSATFQTLDAIYKRVAPKDTMYTLVDRAYVNMFAPGEDGYYHTDGDCITMLYYATPEYDIDEGGYTHLVDQRTGNVESIAPFPGRIALFYGMRRHTASGFRTKRRFSVAVKYLPSGKPSASDMCRAGADANPVCPEGEAPAACSEEFAEQCPVYCGAC